MRTKTSVDMEMLAIGRIRRELEELPTAKSRVRALRYVLDALEEDLSAPGQPPEPTKQPELPFGESQNGKTDPAPADEDLFGAMTDG